MVQQSKILLYEVLGIDLRPIWMAFICLWDQVRIRRVELSTLRSIPIWPVRTGAYQDIYQLAGIAVRRLPRTTAVLSE